MGANDQQRIPKNQKVHSDLIKYLKQGITLLAAQLATEDTIDDYWLITNPASIDHFGHVVAIITDSQQNKHVLLVEAKLQFAKTMRLVMDSEIKRQDGKYDIPLHKYLECYKKIINLDINDELKEELQDIPHENFYFCLVTNMSRNITVQSKNQTFEDVKLTLNHNGGNLLSCFGSYGQYPTEMLPEGYERFLKQFYIFPEQPNTEAMYKELEEYIGKSTSGIVNNLCDVIESTVKANEYCLPLTKIIFFEKCLEAQLSEVVLS